MHLSNELHSPLLWHTDLNSDSILKKLLLFLI